MKCLSFNLFFLFVFIQSNSQVKVDTANALLTSILSSPVNVAEFTGRGHPKNSIFFINNRVIEPDSTKISWGSSVELQGYSLFFYPRKNLIGFYVSYWIQLDKLDFTENKAIVWFRTIRSGDNWFEEYDEVELISKFVLKRANDGQWTVKSRIIRNVAKKKR